VPGEEESEGFIAKLLGGHARAVFVLGVDEKREEIAGVVVGIAALLNDAIDDEGEFADGVLGLEIAASGEPARGHQEATKVHGVLEEDLEVFADLRGFAFDIGMEKRFTDDLEGETHHGVVKIESLAGLPGLNEAGSALGHRGSVVRDAVAVEGRLHHAALPEPEVAFAGEQSVAEQVAIRAEDAAFDEFAGVVDDDVFDVVGVEEEVGAKVEEAETDDVAIFACDTGHEGEGIPAEGAAEAGEETLFRAGRIGGHGEMVCEGEWEREGEWGKRRLTSGGTFGRTDGGVHLCRGKGSDPCCRNKGTQKHSQEWL
jgi:hypothetical protein